MDLREAEDPGGVTAATELTARNLVVSHTHPSAQATLGPPAVWSQVQAEPLKP